MIEDRRNIRSMNRINDAALSDDSCFEQLV